MCLCDVCQVAALEKVQKESLLLAMGTDRRRIASFLSSLNASFRSEVSHLQMKGPLQDKLHAAEQVLKTVPDNADEE